MAKFIYKKRNGEIVEKYSPYYTFKKIGEENRWGWKIIDIQESYKGKYYPIAEYNSLINRYRKRIAFIRDIKKQGKQFIKDLINSIKLLIVLKFFESLFAK